MWAYLRACDSARPRGWVALAVGASALGMASKAVMAAAPLLVLLHDRAFVAGSFRAALARRRGLYAGLAATWAILAALLATAPRAKSVGFGFDVGPLDYVAAQGPIVLGYLARAFWPAELVGDHGPLVATSLADTWPAVAAVGALVVASAVLAAVRPRLGYAGAWVFLLLGPSSSVVPIVTEVGADRRMLLPLAALVALAVALAWRLLARVARAGAARTAGEALLFAAAAVLLLRTRAAAEPYASALAFWRAAVVERPANPRAHYNFADVLRARGQDEAAMRELEETLRLSPRYTDAHVNLGGLYAASGQYARAVEHLGRAAELRPGSAGIRYNLGLAWGAAGRTDLAAEALSEAVRLDPAHRAARLALARALARLERAEEARAEVEELLRRDPDDREARELRRQLGR
jgi:tetratricopeptide (TPR) repeat protein